MGNFRKPLNTQELKSYARQNNIEIASTTALSNCGVLRPPANTGALKSDETENCLIDDESEGFQYFAGPREGRTYTAELRFRNQFEFEDTGNRPKAEKPLTGEWNTVKDFSLKAAPETPLAQNISSQERIQSAQSVWSAPRNTPETAPESSSQWKVEGDLMENTPESTNEPAGPSAVNMLDLIDEDYQPLHQGPKGYPTRPAEVQVDYDEESSSLTSPERGLGSSLNPKGNRSKSSNRFSNKWTNKADKKKK